MDWNQLILIRGEKKEDNIFLTSQALVDTFLFYHLQEIILLVSL